MNLEDAHIDPAFEITDRNWALAATTTDGSLPAKYLVRYDSHSASYIPPPIRVPRSGDGHRSGRRLVAAE